MEMNENSAVKSNKLVVFAKSLRKGQWFRLAGVAMALLAIVLYVVLPQVAINYQLYDSTSNAGPRDYNFPTELISGFNNLFGGSAFCFYQKSTLGAEVLTAKFASFNWFGLALILVGLIACGLDVWLTFTKQHEKNSKLTTLLFFVAGIMALAGPIWFIVINHFGAADWTPLTYISQYWLYDSLYVHDAYGAILVFAVFTLAAVLFGTGTSFEGGDKDELARE